MSGHRTSNPTTLAHRARNWWPMLASTLVHGVLIITAATVVWRVLPTEEPLGPATIVDFEAPAPSPAAAPTPNSAAPTPTPTTPPPTPTAPPPTTSTLPAPPPTTTAPPPLPQPPRAVEPQQDLLAHDLPEVRFAGLGASNAKSIVYVVDASGSMLATLPRVRQMLTDSLRALSPVQRFQVIYFRDNGSVAFRTPTNTDAKLIRATRSNINDAITWLNSIQARGGSDPLNALGIAITQLKPDAIFVLSKSIREGGDQENARFRERVLRDLDNLNPIVRDGRRRTTINTIQFHDNDPGGLLAAIGAAHGNFKFLARNDPNNDHNNEPQPQSPPQP